MLTSFTIERYKSTIMTNIQEFFESFKNTSDEIVKLGSGTYPIVTKTNRYTLKRFIETSCADFPSVSQIPEVSEFLFKKNPSLLMSALRVYTSNNPPPVEEEKPLEIDENGYIEKENAFLNIDLSGRDTSEFFLTSKDDVALVGISADRVIRAHGIPLNMASKWARNVHKDYQPRSDIGLFTRFDPIRRQDVTYLNSYTKPEWLRWKEANPVEWRSLSRKTLPPLAKELIEHLIPSKIERDYLSVWIRASLIKRSRAILLLCGVPGCGKNRLKFVLQALHGCNNTTDGKESTLRGTFNSQLRDNTLLWFDELRFNLDMSNRLKEAENETISIEAKGVDATRSTEIHSSVVISNNSPRHNYIVFEDRKYAPLTLNEKRLETSMDISDITLLTQKIDERNPNTFDVVFVAQIAKYFLSNGKKNRDIWPMLEYKGPMFWKLCHTSMKMAWRKAIYNLMSKTAKTSKAQAMGYDKTHDVFLWSKVAAFVSGIDKSVEFDTPPTCEDFFRKFRDIEGKQVFEVFERISGIDKIQFDDFYIRVPDVIAFNKSDLVAQKSDSNELDL